MNYYFNQYINQTKKRASTIKQLESLYKLDPKPKVSFSSTQQSTMPGESEEKCKRKEIEEKKAKFNKQKTMIVPKSDNNQLKFRKAETMVDTLIQKNQNKMNVERPSKNHLTSLPTFHLNSMHNILYFRSK